MGDVFCVQGHLGHAYSSSDPTVVVDAENQLADASRVSPVEKCYSENGAAKICILKIFAFPRNMFNPKI